MGYSVLSVNIVLIGLSTVEAIPLFHLYPGGSALRLLARPARSLECNYDLDICDIARGPEAFTSVEIPIRAIQSLASRWSCDVIFLDGLEPLESLDSKAIREGINSNIALAARIHGFIEPSGYIDYYLVEDISVITGASWLRVRVLRVMEDLNSKGKPFEAHIYLDEPNIEELREPLELLESSKAPLHVTIYNPKGGGAVRRLYEMLRGKLNYVYVHTKIYDEVNTYCPNCNTIILHREGVALRNVNLGSSGRCPRCNAEIKIVGVVRGRTRRSLLRIARGGAAWYNPLFYKTVVKL